MLEADRADPQYPSEGAKRVLEQNKKIGMKTYITKIYIENGQLILESPDGRMFTPAYDYTGIGGALDDVEMVELVDSEEEKPSEQA